MLQAEALSHLENFRMALQKVRSNCAESTGYPLNDHALGQAFPWLFGNYCPLPALEKVQDRGSCTAEEFYNFMVVAERFMPEVSAAVHITTGQALPKPTLDLLRDFQGDESNG
jgi:hypothetical protein